MNQDHWAKSVSLLGKIIKAQKLVNLVDTIPGKISIRSSERPYLKIEYKRSHPSIIPPENRKNADYDCNPEFGHIEEIGTCSFFLSSLH